ncbi:protein of unknown function [Clostridium beijerinckii]|nr:protein of unknown function [Clostridium beijerinckii]
MRDNGMTIFKEIFFLSFHAIYVFVGIPKRRSTGVVNLFDTTKENNEPITSVFPKPVIPFVKYANKVEIKRYMFCIFCPPISLNYIFNFRYCYQL